MAKGGVLPESSTTSAVKYFTVAYAVIAIAIHHIKT
jgi:hypothetical protein